MKRKAWMTYIGILFVGCLGTYILLALYWFPYTKFEQDSLAAVPKFDALNQAVFDALPIPRGAVEVERHSWGIKYPDDTRYDRRLEVYYLVDDTTGAVKTYKNYFISHGWIGSESPTGVGYHLDTACVSVVFPSKYAPNKYFVSITHDFLNQDFSPRIPKLPNLGKYNLLEIYKGLKFSVGTCPYRQLDLFGTE